MARLPLYYTFGNHMHWVDMEWLWGYHVLPGSVRDMLRFCQETGAKGNVNFEGIGYEKLAAEDPSALAELKAAVQDGTIEPVGCSYGQPYGLFHGGESNVRQRIYGVRTAMRLLGVRPRTFWEEEFDFFPQLPQMLRGVGFSYASLFFQWTWHTPEVPKEEVPVVWWEGQDGSRLLCATRNKLNLHQWPEDMELTFSSLNAEDATGLVLQWLELMPSPDWMCRSEVLLPKMKELLSDERFEIKMATLGGYLGSVASDGVPTRRYTMDDVWHGMSLGKNGDNIRRLSREAESLLLSAETLAAISGLFGRPYAQWDVYPTWELEEAWRELLSAQHHDNDECEGLCGHVGRFSYERSRELAGRIGRALVRNILKHNGVEERCHVLFGGLEPRALGQSEVDGTPRTLGAGEPTGYSHGLIYNPLGWTRKVQLPRDFGASIEEVPAFGIRWFPLAPRESHEAPQLKPRPARFKVGDIEVERDDELGCIRQVLSPEFPDGVFNEHGAGGGFVTRQGETQPVQPWRWVVEGDPAKAQEVRPGKDEFKAWIFGDPLFKGIVMDFSGEINRPDPGLKGGFFTEFHPNFRFKIVTDQPYGISETKAKGTFSKKYPTGDWMTSPQWFETVEGPFTALTLVDLVDLDNPDRGLLIIHNGSQQWFFDEGAGMVRCLINMYDPWDEDYFQGCIDSRFLVIPHGPITNAQRWKIAQEWLRPLVRNGLSGEPTGPSTFSALSCSAENVLPTAFYRETEDYSGRDLERYAGKGMGYPYVVRLVEFDGIETTTKLTVAGTVVKAYKTNLLGEIETELSSRVADAKSEITLRVKPFEIVTLYLDIVEGRKQTRDLDAKREIWATVHRVEE